MATEGGTYPVSRCICQHRQLCGGEGGRSEALGVLDVRVEWSGSHGWRAEDVPCSRPPISQMEKLRLRWAEKSQVTHPKRCSQQFSDPPKPKGDTISTVGGPVSLSSLLIPPQSRHSQSLRQAQTLALVHCNLGHTLLLYTLVSISVKWGER